MDKPEDKKNTRRAALKFGLATSFLAAFSQLPVSAKEKGQEESGEKIKMLAPDGTLVEIDRSVLNKTASKKAASNDDIKNFIDRKNNKL